MTSLFEQMSVSRNVLPLDFMLFEERPLELLKFATAERMVSSVYEPSNSTAEQIEQAECGAELQTPAASEAESQFSTSLDKTRLDAVAETTLNLEHELQLRLEQERAKVSTVCTAFAGERQRYFAAAESEVVRLALAIAGRVLSREISQDPMHLTDTIKAALAKVRDGSMTRLRVREEESADWMRVFEREGQMEVVVDPRLACGECVLETKVGSVELGVRAQMAEIERSFSEWMGDTSLEEAAPC